MECQRGYMAIIAIILVCYTTLCCGHGAQRRVQQPQANAFKEHGDSQQQSLETLGMLLTAYNQAYGRQAATGGHPHSSAQPMRSSSMAARSHLLNIFMGKPQPEVDDETREFLEKTGYRWDEEKGTWVKGTPRNPEARSSARVLEWTGSVDRMTAKLVKKATKRFESKLQEARTEAIGNIPVANKVQMNQFLKSLVVDKFALWLWVYCQFRLGYLLNESLEPFQFDGNIMAPIALGLLFAPLLSTLRRKRWSLQPGVEDVDGVIERLIVDDSMGSMMVPAPWDWRGDEPAWQVATCIGESVASVNCVLIAHAIVQSSVADWGTGVFGNVPLAETLGVLAIAMPAALQAAITILPDLDGTPDEIKAADSLAKRADSYYAMMATSEEERVIGARATRLLADAWRTKFGILNKEVAFKVPALAFAQATTSGLLWLLAGKELLAPMVALIGAAVDIYLLRPDTELTRAKLSISDVFPEEE